MRLKRLCVALVIICLNTCLNVWGQNAKDSVKIYFRQGYSTLDASIGNNKEVLHRIADSLSISYADSIYQLKNIIIIGGASPEGSIELNKRLSMKRANVLFNYFCSQSTLPDASKNFIFLGRDWRGLLQLVQKDNNVPYQNEVIAFLEDIIQKSANGEQIADNNVGRLSRFKGGEPYRYMYQNLFPELRASRVILFYDKIWNPRRVAPVATNFREPTSRQMIPPLELPVVSQTNLPEKPFYMAVKTNMLYDVLLVPNIGIEFYLGCNCSIATNWMYGWWKSDRSKWYWRAYGGDLAIRKWLGRRAKEKPLTGHHLGVYGQVLTYDFLLGKRGYMAGEPGGDIFDRANYAAGVEYGYSLPIARRLNIDFSVGVGYMWGKYYEYIPIEDCYVWQATKKRNYFGPTKFEISLVWLLGRGNVNLEKGGKR